MAGEGWVSWSSSSSLRAWFKCAFARDVRRKKRARQRALRRQTELRARRAMLRRVARRLAEDAAQYAKLAEATDDRSIDRYEASGAGRTRRGWGSADAGESGRNRRRHHGRRDARVGLSARTDDDDDDVGMVEIARSPRYSPRYSPGYSPGYSPRGGAHARGWRGPGSYREYTRSNPDGDGVDPGFSAGIGSVQGFPASSGAGGRPRESRRREPPQPQPQQQPWRLRRPNSRCSRSSSFATRRLSYRPTRTTTTTGTTTGTRAQRGRRRPVGSATLAVASPRSTSPIARSSDIHVDVDAADMDDGSDVAVDVTRRRIRRGSRRGDDRRLGGGGAPSRGGRL